MKGQPSDRAIARVLAAQVRESPASCPDDNILAAYLEFRLGSAERQRLEAHAAACSSCQDILGLAMRLEPEQGPEAARAESPPGRRVVLRLSMPVSVIALIVAGVTLAALLPRVLRKGEVPKEADRIAENLTAQPAWTGFPAAAPESNAPRPTTARRESVPSQPRSPAGAPESSGSAAGAASIPAAAQPPPASDQGDAAFVAPPAGGVRADRPIDAVSTEDASVKGVEPPPPLQGLGTALRESAVPAKAELKTAEKSKDGARELALPDAGRLPGAADSKTARAADAALQVGSLGQEAGPLLKAGEKSFRRAGDSIVDLEALSHPDAPRVEIKAESKEYGEIAARLEGLDELWRAGLTLTIYWEGKIVVVRRKTGRPSGWRSPP